MESTSNLGKLPIVKIAGFPFYVDRDNSRYIDRDLIQNVIRDDDLRWVYGSGAQGILFDKKTRNIFNNDLENGRMPGSVVPVYVPLTSELPLDLGRPINTPDHLHKLEQGYQQSRDKEIGGMSL